MNGRMVATTKRAIGDDETPLAQAALFAAERLDVAYQMNESSSSVAALLARWQVLLTEYMRSCPVAADPVDELQARRERRVAGR